jgi:hypothetical protein
MQLGETANVGSLHQLPVHVRMPFCSSMLLNACNIPLQALTSLGPQKHWSVACTNQGLASTLSGAPVSAGSEATAHQAAATVASDGAHISKVHVDQTHFLQASRRPQHQHQQRQRQTGQNGSNLSSAVFAVVTSTGRPPAAAFDSAHMGGACLSRRRPCCGPFVPLYAAPTPAASAQAAGASQISKNVTAQQQLTVCPHCMPKTQPFEHPKPSLTVMMSLIPLTPACSTSSASRKACVSVVLLSLASVWTSEAW